MKQSSIHVFKSTLKFSQKTSVSNVMYRMISFVCLKLAPRTWAPAGIFPGGGANLWGGPKKICEGGPPHFFRQALKYAYRGGGCSFDARRVFF